MTCADTTFPERQHRAIQATEIDADIASRAVVVDVIVARMGRLPFTRKHRVIAVLPSTGTFSDAFAGQLLGGREHVQ